MTTEVRTKQELATAILSQVDEIHVASDKLALGIMTQPQKHRFVFYAMHVNGYKLNTLRCLGMFDIRLIKKTATA
jgi:hypothetical protein